MRLNFSQRGFSLIELLVAVFVIVLLTGVVSLNVGRGGAALELESEVRHLSGLLAFASAEAGLSAADHGLFIARDSDIGSLGYEGIWLRRFDQGWTAPRASSPAHRPCHALHALLPHPLYPSHAGSSTARAAAERKAPGVPC